MTERTRTPLNSRPQLPTTPNHHNHSEQRAVTRKLITRAATTLALLITLAACSGPLEPASVIGIQTTQDIYNTVPLLENKATLFITPDDQPVTVTTPDGETLPNPLPAELATGAVIAGGQHFHFKYARPLRIALLPIGIGDNPAPDLTEDELNRLKQAVIRQLPFNNVHFTVLPEQHLQAPRHLWNDTLALTKRHHHRSNQTTIAVLPYIPNQEFTGYAKGQTAALMLRRRNNNGLNKSTFLHELAHVFGARHAPCGGAANPDPAFPNNTGAVPATDWMFNSHTMQLITTPRNDLMSYCSPRWPSVYTTMRILP